LEFYPDEKIKYSAIQLLRFVKKVITQFFLKKIIFFGCGFQIFVLYLNSQFNYVQFNKVRKMKTEDLKNLSLQEIVVALQQQNLQKQDFVVPSRFVR
jgi:uncharacterized membrane protein YukC